MLPEHEEWLARAYEEQGGIFIWQSEGPEHETGDVVESMLGPTSKGPVRIVRKASHEEYLAQVAKYLPVYIEMGYVPPASWRYYFVTAD